MYYDYTFLIMIPAMILALYAQLKVSSTFKKFSETTNARRLTGAQAAQEILDKAGIRDVMIEQTRGKLTDHYDPRTKTLRLSESVYNSTSLSAVGVAAHETGHALQHENGYAPLSLRSAMVPVVNFGSTLVWPLVIIGMVFMGSAGNMGWIFMNIAVVILTLTVIFSLVTLPVEFNASSQAVDRLQTEGILTSDEIAPVKKVLRAAAMTYVASAAVAVLQLVRMILLSRRRR